MYNTFYSNTAYLVSAVANLGADLPTSALDMQNFTGVTFVAKITSGSSPTATLYIQISNDGAEWINTAVSASITADSTNVLTLTSCYARYARLFYDRTSGDGIMNATACAKM